MKRPAIEKASAPAFVEYLEEKNINTIVFDVDGTTLDTLSHFKNVFFRLGLEVTNNYLQDVDDLTSEQIARDLDKEVYKIFYANNGHPVLIGKQYKQALNSYLTGEQSFKITEEMEVLIDRYQEICYTTSPKAYEGTKKLLRMLLDWNIGVVFNSHAQDSWTGVKVSYMEDLAESPRPFPYVTTSLDKKKGVESWLEACLKTNTKPKYTLGVGDNFDADITPAMAAGYRNLVWVNPGGKSIPEDFRLEEGVNLYVIEHIRELKFLGESHRV